MQASKYSIYLFLSICLLGCKSQENYTGKLYFDYDAIYHYKIILKESQVNELYAQKSDTTLDSLRYSIILDDTPTAIYDTTFIDYLENIGYKKTNVHASLFGEINSIFIEKKTQEILANSCIYVYRDILIFRKMGKIVGTAKICFECIAHHIVGTEANTQYFGQNGDYTRLEKILSQ
jgi:hypothetical protein